MGTKGFYIATTQQEPLQQKQQNDKIEKGSTTTLPIQKEILMTIKIDNSPYNNTPLFKKPFP